MAATLGSFSADSTLAHVAVLALPSPGSTFTPTSELGEFTLDSTLTPTGKLGQFQLGAWVNLNFTCIPNTGMTLNPGSLIVGDPSCIPNVGMTLTPGAPVSGYSVVRLQWYPRVGMTLAPAAVISSDWIQHNPNVGMTLGVAAKVDFDVRPNVGMTLAPHASMTDNIPFKPSVGMTLAVNSPVIAITPLTVTPNVGMTLAIAAPVSSGAIFTPNVNMTMGVAASYSSNWTTFTPNIGITVGVGALAYMIPAGGVSTTENPYNTAYLGWSINYETNAPSRYEGMAANSMCHLNGVTYVANAGGIYALTGADDAGQPIHASITLPKTDYSDSHNKRMPSAFVGLRSSGQMRLKAITNNLTGLYYSVTPPDSNMRGSRVKMGEGIDGRYWTFRLDNVGGTDFEVDSIEFNPIILKRRGV